MYMQICYGLILLCKSGIVGYNLVYFCFFFSVFSKYDLVVDLDGDFYSVYQVSIKLYIYVIVIVNIIFFEG